MEGKKIYKNNIYLLELSFGDPQGPILGLLLFLIACIDLPSIWQGMNIQSYAGNLGFWVFFMQLLIVNCKLNTYL